MKNIFKIFFLVLFALGISSCDKNENFEILQAADSFQIVAPTSGSIIVLNDANLTNNALFISWKSTTASASTTYTIEVAQTGTDFANPVVLATTETSNFSMSVAELNSFMLDTMGLDPEVAVSLDIRISDGSSSTQVVSVVVTPYRVEFPEFFLVGSLTNWTPADALPMTRIDVNIFEITINLLDGDEFKFLPTNTGWDGDWGKDPNNEGSLIVDGEQNLSGYAAGKYKVRIDMNTFTYTVEAIIAPENLYLVGSITGWEPTTSLPFFNGSENVFTIVANLPDGAEVKFLPTNIDWTGDWGEDPNNAGSIIVDGESNVKGYQAGTYLITVDYNTLTFKLDLIDNLYLVGSLTGWDPGTSIQMGNPSLGVFSTIIDLADGDEFKFLPTNTGWDGDWGEDPNNAGRIIVDGESNVTGNTAGKYVVAVNFNTLSFTVSAISAVPANLYLVGGFNGWSNDVNDPQFTETSSGVFEITQDLSAGDEFKFVPVAGDWGNDWGESKTAKGVLEQNSEQNMGVSVTATYTIIVNFNNGTISLIN